MATNNPSQGFQEEAEVADGEEEDRDDEVDPNPVELLEHNLPAVSEPSVAEAIEEAMEAVERVRASEVEDVVIAVDSEGDDSDDRQSVGEEAVEAVEAVKEKARGGEIKSEGLGKPDGLELEQSSILNCPVCYEPWRAEGAHRVCCIPCGHIYGRSCLERWFKQCGNKAGKCPQCNRIFKRKEIINLYAPLIVVPNDDLEKEVRCLREENKSLKLEKVELITEINKHKKHARDAESFVRQKMACVEHTLSIAQEGRQFECSAERTSTAQSILQNSFKSQWDDRFGACRFVLQNELGLDGARVMGIDGSSQIVIVSGKSPGTEREHILTKISLLSQNEVDKIQLPSNTKAIKDLSVLPNGLALLASLGKKLLLFSLSSNNLVLKYDLPAPAWSCSADNSPHYVYAGLQNGMLLTFDIRQTAAPMQIMEGLTRYPVHTVHCISLKDGVRRILTASCSGPCVWEVGSGHGRPLLIPGTENRGVCISLAASGSLDSIVASFRPKVEVCDTMPYQTPLSPSPISSIPGKVGSHILIKGVNSSSFQSHEVGRSLVSELRMPKSALLCIPGSSSLFAYGDESSHAVHIWDLPSFNIRAEMKPHQHPILDLRYCQRSSSSGLLGCISEDRLQVFSCRV